MATNFQAPMAWRYCGNQIKLWRTRAGVTRQQLGEEAGYCEETIKSVEQGRRRASLHLLQVADQMCGADGMVAAAQAYLQPEKYPARSQEFMDLEAAAISYQSYEPMLIPGLLQTPEYTRALMNESCPPFDDDTIEERVAARVERQEKLTRPPYAHFGFVIHETAHPVRRSASTLPGPTCAEILGGNAVRSISLPALRRCYAVVAVALLIASTGCSSHGGGESDTGSLTAEEVVRQLVEKVPTARASVVFTAESDANEMLGRPGGYTSKASFTDTRITDQEPDGGVEAGGSVEVFAKSGQAKNRAEYIRKVTEGVPMFAEYNYVSGTIVLRVAKGLTPDQAKEYETALQSISGA